MKRINKGNLKVDSRLLEFLNDELLPGTDIDPMKFWSGFDKAVHELTIINKTLLFIAKHLFLLQSLNIHLNFFCYCFPQGRLFLLCFTFLSVEKYLLCVLNV